MPLLARRAASATERTLVYFRMTMYMRPPMRLSSSPRHQSISGRCWTRAYFRDGSNSEVRARNWAVRFALKNRHRRPVGHVRKVPDPEVITSFDHFVGAHQECF